VFHDYTLYKFTIDIDIDIDMEHYGKSGTSWVLRYALRRGEVPAKMLNALQIIHQQNFL